MQTLPNGHASNAPCAVQSERDILREELRANRAERQAQTRAFTEALDKQTRAFSSDIKGLRGDVRALGALALVVIAALAGVQVYRGAEPGSISLASVGP
jgi:hypothetical protein